MKFKNAITKKIESNIKAGNEQINPSITLQLILLDSVITDYFIAKEDIENNGIKCFHNAGKTIGSNPSVKIKLECAKLIIRLLKEINVKDVEEIDDFINSLTT